MPTQVKLIKQSQQDVLSRCKQIFECSITSVACKQHFSKSTNTLNFELQLNDLKHHQYIHALNNIVFVIHTASHR